MSEITNVYHAFQYGYSMVLPYSSNQNFVTLYKDYACEDDFDIIQYDLPDDCQANLAIGTDLYQNVVLSTAPLVDVVYEAQEGYEECESFERERSLKIKE
mmetsp:Transcript_4049/g.6138  ORF Transcript_4049/g.6138 Transcript_4049/m.6138 type:complete len:100 (-) Transcript_4049:20-319(-)